MATQRDYYEVLGIQRDASGREIATSYRRLAVKYHPDSNRGDEDATKIFKEAAAAYEVLSDPEKRAKYDRFGHAAFEGGGGGGAGFRDVEDIFEAFGEMFGGGGGGGGGIFGDMFGGGGRQRVRRGRDVRADLTLTLEEAARGVNRDINFRRSKICDTCEGEGSKPGSKASTCRRCGGHGQVIQSGGILRVQTTCPDCRGAGSIITDPCEDCRGQGVMAEDVTLNVAIPAGVSDGTRVRLQNEGEPSPNNGPAGDCYCFLRIEEHHLFDREGANLLLRLPVTYSQAALGATIEVPTLEGRAELTIPAGTQSGEVFHIRGKGVPDLQSRRTGDLVVQTFIETPKKLNTRQEELLRELAELENKDVTPHRKSFLETIRDYFTGQDETSEDNDE